MDIYIYCNKSLHQEELTLRQMQIAYKKPNMSFLHGCLLKVPDDIAIAPAIRNGVYEYFEICHLKKILKAGNTFVDIGACVGLYSVVASKLVGEFGKVISVEPYDTCYLYSNLFDNDCSNSIVYNLALGNKDQICYLQIEENNFGNTIVTNNVTDRQIFVTTIDKIIPNTHSSLVIKIDSQGDEINILQGSLDTVKKASFLLVEVAPKHLVEKGQDFKDLITMLELLGFKLHIFAPNTHHTKQVDFLDGYTLICLEKQKLIDLIQWELSANPNFFLNVWCQK